MSYVSVIESNIHTLLRCTNINVMIIACLDAGDALSEDKVSQITTMKPPREQCRVLYDWMKTSVELYECFLNVMQTNDQVHVSNFLTGIKDDLHLPLSDSRYERLKRVKPKLMQIIHYDEELVSSLEANRAISETDCQDVRVDVLTNYKRNWILISAIQRRSNHSFICFEEALRETHQGHATDYLSKGEILAVHVNTNQPELDDELSQSLNDVIFHENNPVDPDDPSERVLSELHKNSIRPVASKPGHSIIVFFYCKTIDDMIVFTEVLTSGRLRCMLERTLHRLFTTLKTETVGSLDVRLRLDDEEILFIEEITGVDLSNVPLKNPTSYFLPSCSAVVSSTMSPEIVPPVSPLRAPSTTIEAPASVSKVDSQKETQSGKISTTSSAGLIGYLDPPQLIKSLPSIGGPISGITICKNQIFITRFNSTKIKAFSLFNFRAVGSIQTKLKCSTLFSWPKHMKDGLCDIVACTLNSCLYTSSGHDRSIVKVNPIVHKVCFSWVSPVGTPVGLSVTRKGNVIVCCPIECKVSEYTFMGHLLNTFDFGFASEGPRHAIQLTGDRYIACYDRTDGKVSTVHCLGSIGLLAARLKSIKLTRPCHLAIDSCHQVLIVERGCKRIVLANPSLDKQRVLLKTDEGSPAPTRICLSKTTGHLIVGFDDGSLKVYKVKFPKSMASAKDMELDDRSWYSREVKCDRDSQSVLVTNEDTEKSLGKSESLLR